LPAQADTGQWSWQLSSSPAFRGISTTQRQPGVQAQWEYLEGPGAWGGASVSTISSRAIPGAGLEADAYAGWNTAITPDTRAFVGVYQYTYPGADTFNTTEAFAQLRWGASTVKWYHSITDLGGIAHSAGSDYVSWDVYLPLRQGWVLVPHVGRQWVHGAGAKDYSDVAISVTWSRGAITVTNQIRDTIGPRSFRSANTVAGVDLTGPAWVWVLGWSF
jgi:uncharacterized protein (TIGR02001 family)